MENQEQTQNPLTYAELKELAEKRSREVERLLVSHKNLQDRYKRILTGLPLGLIIVERDNRVRALNKRAAAFFEYQAEELANKPISFLFPDHGEITSNPEPEKWMGKKKSGEIFATEVFVNELYVDGEDKLFISVLDITERHRLEQLRQPNVALRKRVSPPGGLSRPLRRVSQGQDGVRLDGRMVVPW